MNKQKKAIKTILGIVPKQVNDCFIINLRIGR